MGWWVGHVGLVCWVRGVGGVRRVCGLGTRGRLGMRGRLWVGSVGGWVGCVCVLGHINSNYIDIAH
jgi:hypothetical protein